MSLTIIGFYMNLISTLCLILIYLYLYINEKNRFLKFWLYSWIFYSLRFIAQILLSNEIFDENLLLIIKNLSIILSSLFLLLGAYELIYKKLHKYFIYVSIVISIWSICAVLINIDSIYFLIPLFLFAGVSNIVVGLIFIKKFAHICCAKTIGIVFVIWGIHKLNYPFIYNIDSIAPYGYILGTILAMIIGIGIIIVYFNIIKLELGKSEHKFKALFNNSPDFVFLVDNDGKIIDINSCIIQTTKIDYNKFKDIHIWDTELWRDKNELIKTKFKTAYEKEDVKFQVSHSINGLTMHFDVTIKAIFNQSNLEFFIIEEHDITDIILTQEKMKTIYYIDSLTEFPNRFSLLDELQSFKNPSLAIFNIDSFKEINDFYGHKIGDIVIKEFGAILNKFVTSERLYRIYADEFAFLSANKSELLDKIPIILDYIQKHKIPINGSDITISVTVGVASTNENPIIKADMALKKAKESKKDFILYTDSTNLENEYKNNIFWINKLQKAIEENRIKPFYQAILDNKSGKIVKYESLVRLIDENGKIISPFFFLEISKKAKLYPKITKIVIEKSFREFSTKTSSFSVNLTIDDILDDDIKGFILEQLKRYNVADRLIIELVETEGIMNYNDVMQFLNQLKSLGVKIAIDDFGTGYSNFEYLIKLNADFIKIDGSMIKNIDSNISSLAVVETIVNFAKKNNFKTIAEFVSSKNILEIVNSLGIDYSQGYYIAEPQEII